MKFLRRVDGVLTGHGIGDEQDHLGVEQLFQPLHFRHELLVDMQAAGRVYYQGVKAEVAGLAPRLAGEPLNQRRARLLALGVALVDLGLN